MGFDRGDSSARNHQTGKIQGTNVTEEVAVINQFLGVVREKFTALAPSSSSSSTSTPNSNDTHGQERLERIDELYKSPAYSAEKKLLTEINNNGMWKGLAVGVGTFLFLRGGPGMVRRYIHRKRNSISSSSGNTYTFDNTNIPRMMDGAKLDTNAIRNDPKPGIVFRSIRFGLDCFVSFSMAFYGSLYFLDKKKAMEKISTIPLVEGRSMLSDELCDDFIHLYRTIPRKTWETYDGKSPPLSSIQTFVKNCMRRQVMEAQLLEQERGFGVLDSVKHVEIPSPGVPPNTPIDMSWDSTGGNNTHQDANWDSLGSTTPSIYYASDQDSETSFKDSDFNSDDTEDGNNERAWK